MTKKIRLTILAFCVVCFFVLAPYIILYSLGYRIDFEHKKIVATGGIYVRTFPTAEQIIFDSKTSEKPGMFNNAVFIQSLLPKDHTVLVKKYGYYDYYKTLPVLEKEVTKLENVLLFKNNISFTAVTDKTLSPFNLINKFLIKNNNLYYSLAPENSALSALQKTTPLLKNLIAFTLQNNNIIWLGTDGFLYKADLSNIPTSQIKLIEAPIKINKKGLYKIVTDNKYIFINDNGNLLFLNTKTNNLDIFNAVAKDAKLSPDDKNIIYFNNNEMYISTISEKINKQTLLYKSSKEIIDCLWLNNDYIIFNTVNEIIISEIDYRGNVNSIVLPQTADKIFLNNQDKKLYILTKESLLTSEQLTQ